MAHVFRSVIPSECVDIIKEYTGEACWRNGKFIHIHRFPINDYRYQILRNRPRIKQLKYDSIGELLVGSAWFKLSNNKFVVINVFRGYHWDGERYINGDFWEMNYKGEKTVIYF
jgi:hypothetical protein